jgi:glycerophosphoryl diester phosphodiesterase
MNSVIGGLLCLLVWSTGGYVPFVDIIGHRGASHDAPENTLAAIKLAWDSGADAEVDVYLSKDNRIVVIHDAWTKRTGRVNLKVKNTTADRLRRIDVGAFKGTAFSGQQIPFLEEVLAAIPSGRRLFIEIKCGREILLPLRQLLVNSGKMSQVVIIGFDRETMARAKELIEVPTYWLRGSARELLIGPRVPYSLKLIQMAKDDGLDGLDVDAAGVTPEFAQAVKDSGLKLFVWTVDNPARARRMVDLGVDGITTNRPDWLREQLEEPASPLGK